MAGGLKDELAALAAACAVTSNAASWAAASFSDIVAEISRGDDPPGVGTKGGEAGAVATAPGESFMTLNDEDRDSERRTVDAGYLGGLAHHDPSQGCPLPRIKPAEPAVGRAI